MAMTGQDWQALEFKHKRPEIESKENWRDSEPRWHHTNPGRRWIPWLISARWQSRL